MVGFGLLLRVFIVCAEDAAELDEDESSWILAGFDEGNDDDDGCGCCCCCCGGGMGVAVAIAVAVVVVVVDVLLFVVEVVVVEDEDEDVDRLGLERLPPKERLFRRRGVVLDEPNDGRDDFTGGAVSPTKKSALIWALICSLRSRISFVTTDF